MKLIRITWQVAVDGAEAQCSADFPIADDQAEDARRWPPFLADVLARGAGAAARALVAELTKERPLAQKDPT